VWSAAARRFVVLLVGGSAAVALVSLALGALVGASVSRALSLGFYISGAALVLGGFFVGNRGPLRRVETQMDVRFGRGLRSATHDELEESINFSAILVVLGIVLLALAVAVDDRYELV
jgi:hypothetical protein